MDSKINQRSYFVDKLQNELGDIGNDRPVIRMFGITESGHSVMAHIHNFLPYLYVQLSDEFNPSDLNLTDLKKQLNHSFLRMTFPQEME